MNLGNLSNRDNDHRVIGVEDPSVEAPRGVDVRLEGSRNHNQHERSSRAGSFLDGATIIEELTSFFGAEEWLSTLEIVLDIYRA